VRDRVTLLLLLAAGAAVVWLASPELRWPARAFMTFLLVPMPYLMALQARMPIPRDVPRSALYASSAAGLWALAVVAVAAAFGSGFSRIALGLAWPASWATQLAWAAALAAAGVGTMFAARALGIRESQLLAYLLPRTGTERVAFIGLSFTAGICEELVFRGFLVTMLHTASGSMLLALVVSSFAFGVVHAYQDSGGMARATLLGLLLAAPFVLTGSLLAPIIAHVAIDLVGGLWLGERFTR
jgi:membrane protease YdiL (CAAX protease family)